MTGMKVEVEKYIDDLLEGKKKIKLIRYTAKKDCWNSIRKYIHNTMVLTEIYRYDEELVRKIANYKILNTLKHYDYGEKIGEMKELLADVRENFQKMVKHFNLDNDSIKEIRSKDFHKMLCGHIETHAITSIHSMDTLRYALAKPFDGYVFFDERKKRVKQDKKLEARINTLKENSRKYNESIKIGYSWEIFFDADDNSKMVISIPKKNITSGATRERIKKELAAELAFADEVMFTDKSIEEFAATKGVANGLISAKELYKSECGFLSGIDLFYGTLGKSNCYTSAESDNVNSELPF